MRDKEFMEGLEILSKYRKKGYVIESTTDNIWAGSTEIPVDIEDFQRLIFLGFDFEAVNDQCDPGTDYTRRISCYSIYVKNIKGMWHIFDYA